MQISEYDLNKIVVDCLTRYGMSEDDANIISNIYVEADKCGIGTHGVKVLPSHIEKIKLGGYNLKPNIKVTKSNVSFSVVDGDNGFGPICANYCMNLAIKEAKEKGIYTVFSNNNNTYGAAFYYSMMAAKEGLIGITFCNSPAAMAPIGGYEKLIGTNPISIAIPASKHFPIVLDMATSKVAKSKLKVFADKNEKIPLGIALDKNGNETDDPNEAIQGTLLPMADYKGYGLSMIIDILSGLISGAGYLNKVGSFYNSKDKCMNVGFTFIVIDPKQIYGEMFYEEIDKYCEMIENSKKLDGKTITICGYNIFNKKSDSIKNGVYLDVDVLNKLREIAYGKY